MAGKQAGGDQTTPSVAAAPEVDMAPVFTGVKAKVEGDAETTPDAATAPDLAIGVKDKSGASSVVVFVVCLSGVVVIVVVTALSGVEAPGFDAGEGGGRERRVEGMSPVGDMEAEETLMGRLSTRAPPGDRRPLRNSGERELRRGDSGIV